MTLGSLFGEVIHRWLVTFMLLTFWSLFWGSQVLMKRGLLTFWSLFWGSQPLIERGLLTLWSLFRAVNHWWNVDCWHFGSIWGSQPLYLGQSATDEMWTADTLVSIWGSQPLMKYDCWHVGLYLGQSATDEMWTADTLVSVWGSQPLMKCGLLTLWSLFAAVSHWWNVDCWHFGLYLEQSATGKTWTSDTLGGMEGGGGQSATD